MPLPPVDYGPQTSADLSGVQSAQWVLSQHTSVFREAQRLGSVIEGGSQAVTQGILHTQALQATAAVKEKQNGTLKFIDSNPYVSKTDLQQRMSPEDYEAWHSGLKPPFKDAEAVPMFTAAGALFDSEAKQARDAAGQIISLPGWRNQWEATERTESATISERYVNRLAADQMIADQRGQTLQAHDKMVDSAVKPEDIDAAAKFAQTSPWLKPAERRFTVEKDLVAKDSFVAQQAMLGGDTAVMKAELSKLKSDNSAELYPNMNVKQRLDLEHQLTREYGFKAAKATAEGIVGPNVDENGKVNRTGIAKGLAAYDGADKEAVTQAVKLEEAAKLDIFGKQMAEVASSILKAGRNVMTGRFEYAKAMQNPDARKAAFRLNEDAPELLTALSREDQRWENIDYKASERERKDALRALTKVSGENLEKIHKAIDDPLQNNVFKDMTPAQFDVQLYNREMVEPDRAKARAAFASFQKNGGKPDERASKSVNEEIYAAARGIPARIKNLKSAFGSDLLESAHRFIRENPLLPPDKMTDALRAHVKSEMLSGNVLNTGRIWDTGARRIEWETKPEFSGHDFQVDKTGAIIKSTAQHTRFPADVQIKDSEAEYDALPSGATFTGPDGVVRRKP